MEEAGWIERRADPTDRRARRLYLTAKARPVLGRIWNIANETRDEALARFSSGEAEQLIDLLRRVHATLSERVPPQAAEVPEIPLAPAARRPSRLAEERAEPLAAEAAR
jgi:DNA-binding PadR family transcriptional regulator